MVHRIIKPLKTNSFFLFGARGTGKTTFLRDSFPRNESILWIDLLNPEQEDRYARTPLELAGNLDVAPGKIKWVVLDEIQKVPRLLDEEPPLASDELVIFLRGARLPPLF